MSPIVCGSSSVYCPIGSVQPQAVTSGYYTDGGVNSTVNTLQLICPRGHFCVAGVRIGCPGGTFRGSFGGIQELECTICPPGFYCGSLGVVAGLSRACGCMSVIRFGLVFTVPPCSFPSLCGLDQFYCPEGSNSPSRIDPGFYATGAISIRSDQSVCEIGNYCPGNGSMYACPPGRYGGEQGLSSSMCSSSCNDGSREFVCLAM